MSEQAVTPGDALATPPGGRRSNWFGGVVRVLDRLTFVLVIAGLAAGGATYAVLTESPPFGHDPDTLYVLLNADLVILLLLGLLVARRIANIWVRRRRGIAGSRLHVRLVGMFSIVAVVPAIIVATFSVLFLNLGISSWFSDRVSTAVNESVSVAQAYLAEHQRTLEADILAMANDINREALRLLNDDQLFDQLINAQAALRNLTEAIVFDGSGHTLARSNLTLMLQFETIPASALTRARRGDVVRLDSDTEDRVRAIVRLDRFVDSYLLVGRFVEPGVIEHLRAVEGAVDEYQELEIRQSQFQITVVAIYLVLAVLVLLVAIWVGLKFAETLIQPVSNLIAAAERVRAGDLTARVPVAGDRDEISTLTLAFNRMTSQLESQRRDLIDANRQLDQRRRFTETVLGGVSAGVLGVDRDGRINLPNKSAMALLERRLEDLVGRPLADIVPEMGELLDEAARRPHLPTGRQIRLRLGQTDRTLLVRVAVERLGTEVHGFIVTFDDISELVSAQRKAAWADVARRIAHEIKNPLTPIQLSAERLKRKYLRQITRDPETFVACTDTIVRQVGDIGRMVDEFSAFARMPQPAIAAHDLVQTCRHAIALQESRRNVDFKLEVDGDGPVQAAIDPRLVSQALINLLQNAVDAIEGRDPPPEGAAKVRGEVIVRVAGAADTATVCVLDNGRGLPPGDRDSLTEPYVTHRPKGTGLGLAIVKKIMDEHGGQLVLGDRPGGGASICLNFPRNEG
ncbi:MAG: PAS domain-containing sensor histidine kinase [Rhodospirillaceae bacterium]|nr:PAS domain-containing sensor histidine kinase [Rhodospirillaceae bacterium]